MDMIASRLGKWIVELNYEDLSPEVGRLAKQCILDHLGVQVRGATLPQVQPVRRLVEAMGGTAEATVGFYGWKTSVAYAAYVNGTFGHSCEFDDSHFHCGHPGVCVIPAALALAERGHASGRELITAVVAGYQAQAASIGPIHGSTLALGWHGTKVGGVFGAAGAAASLLRLDIEQAAHALTIAASDASGTMEYDQSGGEVKRLHAGSASRSGVQAALLAQSGMTGPLTIFEGKRGIYRLFGDGSPPDVERFWTGHFHILDTMFKLYPAVGTAHAALNALTQIMESEEFVPSDVTAINVGLVDWAIPHGAAITRPTDCISAQFSLAFSLALRLVKRSNDLRFYLDPGLWADAELLGQAEKVHPYPMVIEDGAHPLGAKVEVVLRDGRKFGYYQRAPRGLPECPASDAELKLKFHGLTEGLFSRHQAEQIVQKVDRLEALEDVSELAILLRQ
jgi:2-methylcitrate dehydratase PrpD